MLASRNYPPSKALEPYVKQHYVFTADLPADFEMTDWLLSETAFIRLLIRGDWAAEIAPGEWSSAGPAVFFGPNSKPLKVRVRGPFTVAGVAIRPCGWGALFDRSAKEYADRMLPLSQIWGELADCLWNEVMAAGNDDEQIVAAIEGCFANRLEELGRPGCDRQMERFDHIARTDSTRRVEDIAGDIGLSVRQMERRCCTSFGMTPKAVLRRSRFLDMASAMRGFSSPNEEELAALRYFDESHLIREFRHFSGMTPGQFRETPTPLLTAGLKFRAEAHGLEKEDAIGQSGGV